MRHRAWFWMIVGATIAVVVVLLAWPGPDEERDGAAPPPVGLAESLWSGTREAPGGVGAPEPDAGASTDASERDDPQFEIEERHSESGERPSEDGEPSSAGVETRRAPGPFPTPAPAARLPSRPPRPVARPAPPANSPPLEDSSDSAMADEIRDQFRALAPDLRECYELLLALEPEASDRLVLNLTLTEDPDDPERGLVTLDAIESDALPIEDLACFAEVVDQIELLPPPEEEGEVTIRYPVLLRSGP